MLKVPKLFHDFSTDTFLRFSLQELPSSLNTSVLHRETGESIKLYHVGNRALQNVQF